MKPPKGTFPHVVTTPREVSGSYHHQCAEQRPRTLWSTCGPLRTQADPGGPCRFHRLLERVLFRGLKSPRFLESDFKKRGGFTPDDDRLNAAVSRAGFGPAVSVGCTSALERVTVSSQTPLEVRKVPIADSCCATQLARRTIGFNSGGDS
jgi:hypothetical protein